MKIGDKVEYMPGQVRTGVIGVVTGFVENRARVLCPSGHEWLLRISAIEILQSVMAKPVAPKDNE